MAGGKLGLQALSVVLLLSSLTPLSPLTMEPAETSSSMPGTLSTQLSVSTPQPTTKELSKLSQLTFIMLTMPTLLDKHGRLSGLPFTLPRQQYNGASTQPSSTYTESSTHPPPSLSPATDSSHSPTLRSITSRGESTTTSGQYPEIFSPFTANANNDAQFWRESAEAYYMYCGNSCSQEPLSVPRICKSCFCDSACFVYGDCCPDQYVMKNYTPASQLLGCVTTSYGFREPEKQVMFTKCPDDVADSALASKCEGRDVLDVMMTQPVISQKSFCSYKNRYCAQCHFEFLHLLPWEASITITDPASVANVTSSRELYHRIMTHGELSLAFTYPKTLEKHIRKCDDVRVISQCNVTGLWQHYDINVEKACLLFHSRITYNQKLYRNPFCYLCNTAVSWTEMLAHKEAGGISRPFQLVPLLILLDFKDDADDDVFDDPNIQCPGLQFFDISTDFCRKIFCAPGKRPTGRSDIICTSSLQVNNVYGYKLCLQDNATQQELNITLSLMDNVDVGNILNNTLYYALGKVVGFEGTDDINHQLYIFEQIAERPVNKDATDKRVTNDFSDYVVAMRLALNRDSLKISPTCSPQVFHSLIQNETKLLRKEPDIEREFAPQILKVRLWRAVKNAMYLPVSGPLVCPFVELTSQECHYDQVNQELVILRNGSSVAVRVRMSYFHITDTFTCQVCLTEYKGIFMNDTKPKEKPLSKSEEALYWVSLISMSISLPFLAVSFVIYCVLPSLRTIAGMNNLLLISTLFGAQLLLLLGSQVTTVDWLCQVVGVATHYLWLAVIFAQNACTFHMFYTLSFPLLSHPALANPPAMKRKYATYVFVTSAVFVVVTAIWQLAEEGISGYGGDACYIIRATVRFAMFVVPLTITVLANVTMFVVTITRLRTLQRVESTHSNRATLVLYTKLSVFLGFTWLFGILASSLGSVVLSYVFAVFQGCQGVFMFLAFLANKRVLAMLRETVDRRSGRATSMGSSDVIRLSSSGRLTRTALISQTKI